MDLVSFSPDLPGRFGPRPRTTSALPFRQIDQFPPAEMIGRLVERCIGLPDVRVRQARFAPPDTRALCLSGSAASGPPEAFIDVREFCHLHSTVDGSVHLTLPPAAIERVVALGWAERHPIHTLGLFETVVLVYAPRDADEEEVVFSLIERSCRFASGAEALPAVNAVA